MKNVVLRDTDAMSMSRSLEVRVPYLDHPLVEWALRQPERVKGRGKALLAAAAADLVPPEVLTRRKHGFALPLRLWMRGELRGEVEERLRRPPEALAQLIDTRAGAEVWADYLASGRRWLRPWALYALARWVESLESAAP
jgi:asparagine synthase (glutamine-hydrolysing)